VVNGETLSGEWHNISVVPSIVEDGSGVVAMSLAQPEFVVDAYRNASTIKAQDIQYLFQTPKDLGQGLIDTHEATKGNSSSASYNNATGVMDIVLYSKHYNSYTKTDVVTAWDCSHKEFTTTYTDKTETEADAIALTEPPVGWRYEAQKVDNGDGSWTVIVVKTNSLARSYDYVATGESADSSMEMKEQLDVALADVESVAETDGKAISQQRRHTNDCKVNATTQKETGKEKVVTTKIVSPSGSTSIEEKTFQAARLAAPTSEQGKIKTIINRVSRFFSRFDTVEQVETPTNLTAEGGHRDVFSSSVRTSQTEYAADDILTPPETFAGQVANIDVERTKAGNRRTAYTLETANNEGATSYEADHFSSRVIADQTAAASPLGVISLVAGAIQTKINELTKFKDKIKTRSITDTATAQTIASTIVERNDNSNTSSTRYYNAVSKPGDLGATSTTISRILGLSLNRFKRYDYAVAVTTPKVPASCASGASWTTKGRYYWVVRIWLEGEPFTWWRYYEPIVHTITFHLTAAAAASALSGGSHGSTMHRAGSYLWMAHKVAVGTAIHG